jgi:tryptophan synthase alpha chain
MVCQVADGAVVGSFLVDLLHKEWPQGRAKVLETIKELKAATR